MSFASLLGKHKKTKRRRAENKKRRRTMASASEGGGAVLNSSLSVEDRVRVMRQRRRRSPQPPPTAVREASSSSSSSSSSASSASSASSSSSSSPSSPAPRKTLALMFIVIDALPYEDVWRQWIGDRDDDDDGRSSSSLAKDEPTSTCSDKNSGDAAIVAAPTTIPNVRVFVHAKFPERVRSPWLRNRLIAQSFKPEWGSVEITRAMVALVESALATVPAAVAPDMRLVFASESCLPVVPLGAAARALWSSNASWLDVKSKPRNGYNGSAQWVPIEKSPVVPAECVCKSDQWVALTRTHAELVCGLPAAIGHTEMWQAFRKSCASDEMYFATLLCCAGALPDRNEARSRAEAGVVAGAGAAAANSSDHNISTAAGSNEVTPRKLTFVEWIYPDLDDYSGKTSLADRPVTYGELTEVLVARARAEGCIFARKFKGAGAAKEWAELVLTKELVKQ